MRGGVSESLHCISICRVPGGMECRGNYSVESDTGCLAVCECVCESVSVCHSFIQSFVHSVSPWHCK